MPAASWLGHSSSADVPFGSLVQCPVGALLIFVLVWFCFVPSLWGFFFFLVWFNQVWEHPHSAYTQRLEEWKEKALSIPMRGQIIFLSLCSENEQGR